MDEDFKATPMQPIREILDEVEHRMDIEDFARNEPPCPKCNGTGTQIIYHEQFTEARGCSH